MAKPFEIKIICEEIALGSVVRKLHEMSGIINIDLNLGHGGKKPLPNPASHGNGNGNGSQLARAVVALLMSGEKTINEIIEATGGSRQRAYNIMHQLKKQKIVKRVSPGLYRLSDKAATGLQGQAMPVPAPALPAPVKHGPKGRAVPGSGNKVIRAVLDAAPLRASDLRTQLAGRGLSAKSLSGIVNRAKRDGLIKANGAGIYELTAKGRKIELEAAHG
jgi:hypothetical protein